MLAEWHVDGAADIVNSLIEVLDASAQDELVKAQGRQLANQYRKSDDLKGHRFSIDTVQYVLFEVFVM